MGEQALRLARPLAHTVLQRRMIFHAIESVRVAAVSPRPRKLFHRADSWRHSRCEIRLDCLLTRLAPARRISRVQMPRRLPTLGTVKRQNPACWDQLCILLPHRCICDSRTLSAGGVPAMVVPRPANKSVVPENNCCCAAGWRDGPASSSEVHPRLARHGGFEDCLAAALA